MWWMQPCSLLPSSILLHASSFSLVALTLFSVTLPWSLFIISKNKISVCKTFPNLIFILPIVQQKRSTPPSSSVRGFQPCPHPQSSQPHAHLHVTCCLWKTRWMWNVTDCPHLILTLSCQSISSYCLSLKFDWKNVVCKYVKFVRTINFNRKYEAQQFFLNLSLNSSRGGLYII